MGFNTTALFPRYSNYPEFPDAFLRRNFLWLSVLPFLLPSFKGITAFAQTEASQVRQP